MTRSCGRVRGATDAADRDVHEIRPPTLGAPVGAHTGWKLRQGRKSAAHKRAYLARARRRGHVLAGRHVFWKPKGPAAESSFFPYAEERLAVEASGARSSAGRRDPCHQHASASRSCRLEHQAYGWRLDADVSARAPYHASARG